MSTKFPVRDSATAASSRRKKAKPRETAEATESRTSVEGEFGHDVSQLSFPA